MRFFHILDDSIRLLNIGWCKRDAARQVGEQQESGIGDYRTSVWMLLSMFDAFLRCVMQGKHAATTPYGPKGYFPARLGQ